MKNFGAVLIAIAQRVGDLFRPEEEDNLDPYKPKPTMKNELVAICVGHSRVGDRGAVSDGGVSEHTFNSELAKLVQRELDAWGIPSFIVDRYEGASYGGAMRWLADFIEKKHASVAVELHFNAANKFARGHEWLHWKGSKRSEKLAACLHAEFADAFPSIPPRGVKPKTSGDRGAEFLKLTHCPAVIAEPFFGDNATDWQIASEDPKGIAAAIAAGILDYLKP